MRYIYLSLSSYIYLSLVDATPATACAVTGVQAYDLFYFLYIFTAQGRLGFERTQAAGVAGPSTHRGELVPQPVGDTCRSCAFVLLLVVDVVVDLLNTRLVYDILYASLHFSVSCVYFSCNFGAFVQLPQL